jgi:hypothetical protein
LKRPIAIAGKSVRRFPDPAPFFVAVSVGKVDQIMLAKRLQTADLAVLRRSRIIEDLFDTTDWYSVKSSSFTVFVATSVDVNKQIYL